MKILYHRPAYLTTMASEDTVRMIKSLSDDVSLRMFETLAECDRSDRKLSEMLNVPIDEIRKKASEMEKPGLVISCEEDDCIDYMLDPKQVAILTGYFQLMLGKCSPPKCC